MRCLVFLHLCTFIVVHVFAHLCPTLLILADFDKGFTVVIAVGILLTIDSFLDRKFFLQNLLNSFLSSLCAAAPLKGGGGGGGGEGVCTVTRAIYLYFASIGTLQYGSR